MVRTRTRNYPSSYPVKRRRTMAAATQRKLAKMRSPEVKYRDFNSNAPGAADGLVTQCNVTQGDDGDDYTGSKLFMERIDTCVVVNEPIGACRLTVLMPKDPTSAPVPLSARFRFDERQFHILYDELIPGGGVDNCERRKISIKRMQEKVSATTNVIIKGNLYACWSFSETLSLGAGSTTRLYFTDN
mgnify:CR=1 FL=1